VSKWGLIFELVGFLMLFISSKWLTGGDIQHQLITKYISWIPNEPIKEIIGKEWERIALGFIIIGVLFQIGSLLKEL
jgi:hypothetical protein